MIALFLRHVQQTPPSSSHACLHASHKQMHLSHSPDVVSVHLAVTWCPYPPFIPHSERLFSQVGQVACYVTLFFVYVVLCCILHVAWYFNISEPSGALRSTFPGPKCAAMKGCLSTTGAKFEFHQFHPSNVALYASYHLCVLMWRAEPQASNVDHYEEDSVGDISVRLCPPKSNAASCIFWDGKSSPRC